MAYTLNIFVFENVVGKADHFIDSALFFVYKIS